MAYGLGYGFRLHRTFTTLGVNIRQYITCDLWHTADEEALKWKVQGLSCSEFKPRNGSFPK